MKLLELLQHMTKEKKALRVGWLGGSITEGTAASVQTERFSSLVTDDIAAHLPGVDVVEVNAGVGGTGSNLGLFRMQRDLLSKEPDMLFVEFAVNDYSFADTALFMENIVRNALQYRRGMPIVFVYTLNQSMVEIYGTGDIPFSVAEHEKVADYYHIPSINVGKALSEAIAASGDYSALMADGAHPRSSGHKVYADTMAKDLWEKEFDPICPEKTLCGKEYHPGMVLVTPGMAENGWSYSSESMHGRLPGFLYSDHPGAVLTFHMTGTVAGVYYSCSADSGILEYSVDGGKWQDVDTWDIYCKQFNRAHYCTFPPLKGGEQHNIAFRVSGRKNEESHGVMIRIGAFLYG